MSTCFRELIRCALSAFIIRSHFCSVFSAFQPFVHSGSLLATVGIAVGTIISSIYKWGYKLLASLYRDRSDFCLPARVCLKNSSWFFVLLGAVEIGSQTQSTNSLPQTRQRLSLLVSFIRYLRLTSTYRPYSVSKRHKRANFGLRLLFSSPILLTPNTRLILFQILVFYFFSHWIPDVFYGPRVTASRYT